MDIVKLTSKIVSTMNKKITDEIFLIIQNDRKLMQEYLRLVEKKGLDTVNKSIGRQIKKAYNLTNSDIRNMNPKSTLIGSHQIFE